ITGRGPVNFAAGLYRFPVMTVPSKLFNSTISGAGKTSVLNEDSLKVQRVSVPTETSTEYTSPCAFTEPNVKPTSREFGRQCTWDTTPLPMAGTGRTFIVVRSMTWRSAY